MLYNIYNIDERIYLPITIVLTLIILVICSFHFYKKKKIALNTILSIWSICLSFIAFIAAFLRVDVYFTNDSFVGIMAGFMGACATILVGVQIYNSIDTRNSINKLNEKIEEKIQELNNEYHKRSGDTQILSNRLQLDISDLKKELSEFKEERLLSEKQIEYDTSRANGLAFVSIQPFTSYLNFYSSLIIALEMNDSKLISSAIHNMSALCRIIQSKIDKKEEINTRFINKIKETNFNSIKKYPSSSLIQKEYNETYYKMLNIINSIQK